MNSFKRKSKPMFSSYSPTIHSSELTVINTMFKTVVYMKIALGDTAKSSFIHTHNLQNEGENKKVKSFPPRQNERSS